ncbi:helix-turn-helix domain-containing protein [Rodentibacter trehalosifermentans]|uniref:helix-turn-helix domain-containing protein n=1 Tax=Rodentibacter trehalosifermentans TaxID=1908263 RepID=UPI0009845292|nr:helix-turn-helix transcriptional regulator [Rodentibacter trehalosifermentans]OOF53315.1 transcriptional regulator [Rodentibacter trehalosifermentans]
MANLRLSIHSNEHLWLRDIFLKQRKALGLSQRALCEKMGVVSSFVGKVETGDRRLDIFEFIKYCEALELDPIEIVAEIREKFD